MRNQPHTEEEEREGVPSLDYRVEGRWISFSLVLAKTYASSLKKGRGAVEFLRGK